MSLILEQFTQSVQKALDHLKEDLKSIRTGKANPSVLENIIIETYGGQTKLHLMELATTSTQNAHALLITPFDPSTVRDIEKAIIASPLGLSPQVQGPKIIVNIPQLTQEQREKLKKLVGQKIEEKRVLTRNFRDGSRKKIKSLFDEKQLSEDEKYRLEKELDDLTKKYMDVIQKIRESKEKEIMEI